MLLELGRAANVRGNVHLCKTSGNPSTKGEPHSNCITQHKCNFSAGGPAHPKCLLEQLKKH